jgi:hypothetical protein
MSASEISLAKQAARSGLRVLYWTHRWLGVGTCVLFAMWFASGVVMMYVPFPSLTDEEYVSRLEPIDWSQVMVSPTRALAAAGLTAYPRQLRLEMWNSMPVYRVRDWAGPEVTIAATDGQVLSDFDPAQAASSASSLHLARVQSVQTIERDQWSVAGTFDAHRPLHRVAFDDPAQTVLYVSSRTGAVVLDTTRQERIWNWFGSVPHWIYFTALRKDQPLWRQAILWTSGIGIVSAVTGVWIGILRLRVRRRYREGRMIPYSGWMKWHHIAGLVGGVFLCTWILSGWLSVNPNRWFASPGLAREGLERVAGHSDASFAHAPFVSQSEPMRSAVRARFAWFDSVPLMLLTNGWHKTVALDARSGGRAVLDDARVYSAAERLFFDGRNATRERVANDDAYRYSHHERRPLPVLRLKFNDPARTWVHLNPGTGEILGVIDSAGRANRWWFDALHSLDFRFLIQHRPVWDVVVWLLSAVGLVTSISAIVIGWRRLKRDARKSSRKAIDAHLEPGLPPQL